MVDFPLGTIHNLLPEVGTYIAAWADTMKTDPAIAGVPALSVLASCIGSTRRLQANDSYPVPALIWSAVVAISGSGKSHPLQNMTRMVMQAEKDANGGLIARETPLRYIIKKATFEAMVDRLSKNPRGLLGVYDELEGWLKGMNEYKRGGADEAMWLELYQCSGAMLDTKGDGTVYADSTISITGTTQPTTLAQIMSDKLINSGMLGRILTCMPERNVVRFDEMGVRGRVQDGMRNVLHSLLGLDFVDGDREQGVLTLDYDALQAFKAYDAKLAAMQNAIKDDDERAGEFSALAKLGDSALRLALVLQLTADQNATVVSRHVMNAAIELAEYFRHQIPQIHEYIAEQRVTTETKRRGRPSKSIRQHVMELEEQNKFPTMKALRKKTGWSNGLIEQRAREFVEAGKLHAVNFQSGEEGFVSFRPLTE